MEAVGDTAFVQFSVVLGGVYNFFFQGTWKIAEMINMADLDRFLVRPLPVGLQLLTARIDFDGLNKMGIAAAVFALGASHCNIRWSLWKIVCLAVFLVECCVIRVCMIWIASCASFWMEGGKNRFEFLCYFHWGDGEISADHLSACTAGDICVFDSVCVCQLLSGGVSAGKERDACRVMVMPAVCAVMAGVAVIVLKEGAWRYESSGIEMGQIVFGNSG